eukprot:GHVT01032309.1.p1 GENE.GHVT01032309.1~~GHVT01032309.1.p1  ORF type:complete len:1306 (+),score=208.95 GHVT01032309.1:817-4734(+)
MADVAQMPTPAHRPPPKADVPRTSDVLCRPFEPSQTPDTSVLTVPEELYQLLQAPLPSLQRLKAEQQPLVKTSLPSDARSCAVADPSHCVAGSKLPTGPGVAAGEAKVTVDAGVMATPYSAELENGSSSIDSLMLSSAMIEAVVDRVFEELPKCYQPQQITIHPLFTEKELEASAQPLSASPTSNSKSLVNTKVCSSSCSSALSSDAVSPPSSGRNMRLAESDWRVVESALHLLRSRGIVELRSLSASVAPFGASGSNSHPSGDGIWHLHGAEWEIPFGNSQAAQGGEPGAGSLEGKEGIAPSTSLLLRRRITRATAADAAATAAAVASAPPQPVVPPGRPWLLQEAALENLRTFLSCGSATGAEIGAHQHRETLQSGVFGHSRKEACVYWADNIAPLLLDSCSSVPSSGHVPTHSDSEASDTPGISASSVVPRRPLVGASMLFRRSAVISAAAEFRATASCGLAENSWRSQPFAGSKRMEREYKLFSQALLDDTAASCRPQNLTLRIHVPEERRHRRRSSGSIAEAEHSWDQSVAETSAAATDTASDKRKATHHQMSSPISTHSGGIDKAEQKGDKTRDSKYALPFNPRGTNALTKVKSTNIDQRRCKDPAEARGAPRRRIRGDEEQTLPQWRQSDTSVRVGPNAANTVGDEAAEPSADNDSVSTNQGGRDTVFQQEPFAPRSRLSRRGPLMRSGAQPGFSDTATDQQQPAAGGERNAGHVATARAGRGNAGFLPPAAHAHRGISGTSLQQFGRGQSGWWLTSVSRGKPLGRAADIPVGATATGSVAQSGQSLRSSAKPHGRARCDLRRRHRAKEHEATTIQDKEDSDAGGPVAAFPPGSAGVPRGSAGWFGQQGTVDQNYPQQPPVSTGPTTRPWPASQSSDVCPLPRVPGIQSNALPVPRRCVPAGPRSTMSSDPSMASSHASSIEDLVIDLDPEDDRDSPTTAPIQFWAAAPVELAVSKRRRIEESLPTVALAGRPPAIDLLSEPTRGAAADTRALNNHAPSTATHVDYTACATDPAMSSSHVNVLDGRLLRQMLDKLSADELRVLPPALFNSPPDPAAFESVAAQLRSVMRDNRQQPVAPRFQGPPQSQINTQKQPVPTSHLLPPPQMWGAQLSNHQQIQRQNQHEQQQNLQGQQQNLHGQQQNLHVQPQNQHLQPQNQHVQHQSQHVQQQNQVRPAHIQQQLLRQHQQQRQQPQSIAPFINTLHSLPPQSASFAAAPHENIPRPIEAQTPYSSVATQWVGDLESVPAPVVLGWALPPVPGTDCLGLAAAESSVMLPHYPQRPLMSSLPCETIDLVSDPD